MTFLKTLDTFIDQWIKKWARIPKSAINVIAHLKEGLKIPSISSTYTEAHNISHTRTRLQGDMFVNHVLDHTLQHESSFSHTYCTTTEADKVFLDTLGQHTVEGQVPNYTRHNARKLQQNLNTALRNKVRISTRNGIQDKLSQHAGQLQVQGHLLTLTSQEKEDILWKSTIFQIFYSILYLVSF